MPYYCRGVVEGCHVYFAWFVEVFLTRCACLSRDQELTNH